MKRGLFLLLLLLVLFSCTIQQDETVKVVKEEKENDTGKYSVSFSIGSQGNTQSRSIIPENYDAITSFKLTIMDSSGNKVINRREYKKVNWAPGYVVSEPLELEPGSYTLEELILMDSDYNVLYATPRQGSELENVVNEALPIPFTVVNQDNIVYSQVLDVDEFEVFTTDPITYFGYDLGVLEQVKMYCLSFLIKDIYLDYTTEDLTIFYDGKQFTKTIESTGTTFYVDQFTGPFTIEVSAENGSGFNAVYDNYNIRDTGSFSKEIQLTEKVNAKFLVKDHNGENLDAKVQYITEYSYVDYIGKEGNIYTAQINASYNTEIVVFGASGFEYFNRVYTVDELRDSNDNPIVIQPVPFTVTFPVFLYNCGDFPGTAADIEITSSSGYATIINDVPLGVNTSITGYAVSGDVNITVYKSGIYSKTIEKTQRELNTLNNNNEPIIFNLYYLDEPFVPLIEGFESGVRELLNDPHADFYWTRNSGYTPTSYTGPSCAYEGDYYFYAEANNNINETGALLSPYFNFDTQIGEFIKIKATMYGSYTGTLSVYYQNEGSTEWILIGSISGNQGAEWFDFNQSLDHITGTARIKIQALIGDGYTSDIAIDNVEIGYN